MAHEALTRLVEDDSRRVSYAAREALDMGPTLTQQGFGPAPGIESVPVPTIPVSGEQIEKRRKSEQVPEKRRVEPIATVPVRRRSDNLALDLLRRFWPVLAILAGSIVMIYDVVRGLDDNIWYLSTVAALAAIGIVKLRYKRWWQGAAFIVVALMWVIVAMYYNWAIHDRVELYDVRYVPPSLTGLLLIWASVDGFLPQKPSR